MKTVIRFRFDYTGVPDIQAVEENVVLRLWDGDEMLMPGSLNVIKAKLKNRKLIYYRLDVQGDVTRQQLVAIIEAII